MGDIMKTTTWKFISIVYSIIILCFFISELSKPLGIYGVFDIFKYSFLFSFPTSFLFLCNKNKITLRKQTIRSFGIGGIFLFVLWFFYCAFFQIDLPFRLNLTQIYILYIFWITNCLSLITFSLFINKTE